jgi:high-affinity nickel permease
MFSAPIAILALGFVLGMRHATDPDHVIAVSTIVSRERSILRASLVGVLWGCGHTLTILIVGAAIILFGLAIPTRVGLTMEFSVGLMLILLGILNLTGVLGWISAKFSPAHPPVEGEHAHIHAHGNKLHLHWHRHQKQGEQHHGKALEPPPLVRNALQKLGLFNTLRPLFVGIVHGLAGSAAVALLVLSTIREPKWAVLYLLVFGVGTIAGMMLITTALAFPFSLVGARFARLNDGLITASGLISLAFGLFVAYQIGFVDGLFTTHPGWNPH